MLFFGGREGEEGGPPPSFSSAYLFWGGGGIPGGVGGENGERDEKCEHMGGGVLSVVFFWLHRQGGVRFEDDLLVCVLEEESTSQECKEERSFGFFRTRTVLIE